MKKVIGLVVAGLLALIVKSARADSPPDTFLCTGQSNAVLNRVGPGLGSVYAQVLGDNLSEFCFDLGLHMSAFLGKPVYIVQRAVSGSPIQDWVAPSAKDDPDPLVGQLLARRPRWGGLFKRYITPLAGMHFKGVVQWQGESNLSNPLEYRHLLPALVRSWRTFFGYEVPFVVVQLPNDGRNAFPELWGSPVSSDTESSMFGNAPQMRQAYLEVLNTVLLTGMVITRGLPGGTHPYDRDGYAERAALIVLHLIYHLPGAYAGPTYSGYSLKPGQVRIHFWPETAEGLSSGGAALQGFAIAGADGKYVWADAQIDGDTVLVSSSEVPFPTFVRYDYTRRPWGNLVNGEGMLASPFSTEPLPSP